MNKRNIATGLSGQVNNAILNSVIGQMSDGMWENSPTMRKYWAHCDIIKENGQLFIAVDDAWDSGFYNKTSEWVRNFFAGKIKQIAYEETEGKRWTMEDETELDYLSRIESKVTVAQAYKAYATLKGRTAKIPRATKVPDLTLAEVDAAQVRVAKQFGISVEELNLRLQNA